MSLRVKVSSAGLTRCPGCQTHIRLAATPGETQCPFCDAILGVELARDPAAPSALRGVITAGRSGILAASLLGLPAAACGTEDTLPGDASTDAAADVRDDIADDTAEDILVDTDVADAPISDVYGAPADVQPDGVDDTVPAPMYGAPADVAEPDAPDVEVEDAPDVTPQPEYGAPPDAG